MKNHSTAINLNTGNNLRTYIIFVLIILVFAFIITKEISLPRTITFPVVALGLLVLIFGSLKKPDAALLMLVAYVPFSMVFTGQFGINITGINLTNLLMFIVIIIWLINVSNSGSHSFIKNWMNVAIISFCTWGLFSLLRARLIYGDTYNLEDFFILFKRWLSPILLYFIGANIVKDRQTFKKVLFVIMLVTFIVSLMAIRDYLHYGDRGSMEDSRVGGIFEQPNTLAAFFVYNMFFFLAFFLYYYRSFKYWLLLLPFIACFRGIMVTFSRGAYLAFASGSFMTAFFRSKILFLISTMFFIILVFTPALLPGGMRYRLATTFGGEKVISTDVEEITDPSAGRRIIIWKGALEMIKEQPLFGFGYGTFPYIIGNYAPEVPEVDAHNTYLILAAEMGIPSLVLFIIILLLIIKNAWWLIVRVRERYFKAFALGVLGGIFGLLVANMFGSRLNSEEVSSYFWLYAGLTVAAVKMKRSKVIN